MKDRQGILLWGLLVLLGASWLLLAGCGSESPPEPAAKAAGKQQTARVETRARLVKTVSPSARARSDEAPGPQLDDVIPPQAGPQVGLAEADVRSGPPRLDPETTEIAPPRKPGERGLTLRDLPPPSSGSSQEGEAPGPRLDDVIPPQAGHVGITEKQLRAGPPRLDPETTEIAPPRKPGGRGLTLGDLPPPSSGSGQEDFEVGPPPRPGKPGMTQIELENLRQGPRRQ